MTSLLSVVLGLIVLGVLVFIHELGHFLAAKWCGIRVLAFSLGFGAPLVKKSINGTEYRIGMIPFGGYVKMAGENPDDGRSGSPDEFQSKPVWQRATVAVAGPLFNLLSAFVMLWIMFMAGTERPMYLERPVLGAVRDSSRAAIAGCLPGDSITKVNGKPVSDWEGIETSFAQQEKQYTLTYIRAGVQGGCTINMGNTDGASLPKEPLAGLMPTLPAIVAAVNDRSPAQIAGIRAGDTIRVIDGVPIYSWFQLVSMVENCPKDSSLTFVAEQGDNQRMLQIKPAYDPSVKRMLVGIRVSEGKGRIVRYAPIAALGKAFGKGLEYTTMIFDVIGKLISHKVSANQLSGPLGIIPASGFMVMQGLGPILNFMALIGINLGVLNLMPLVITDGGMLLFLLIEVIRRKPLSEKSQAVVNKVAIFFFMALFLYVTFNDVRRLPEMFKMFGK